MMALFLINLLIVILPIKVRVLILPLDYFKCTLRINNRRVGIAFFDGTLVRL